MPSNNKKNKKNGDKKTVVSEKTASAKKQPSKAIVGSTKPHFFDKSKIDFSLSGKKNEDNSSFVLPDENVTQGFVTAHFYHSDENMQKKESDVTTDASTEKSEPKRTDAHITSLSELMGADTPSGRDSQTVTGSFYHEAIKLHEVEGNLPDISMKELFNNDGLVEKTEKTDSMHQRLISEKPGNISEEAQPDREEPESLSGQKYDEQKAFQPFVPSYSESRRENEALLAALTPGDIKKNGVKEKKKYALSVLRYFAMVVCLAVLIISSVNLIADFARKSREKEKNDELRDAFNSGVIGYNTLGYARQDTNFVPDERLYSDEGDIYKAPEPEVYDMHEKYERMLPNLQALKYVNSSAFAWIKVGGTRVDYPVVRSPQGDNDYYLSHGLDRTYSVSGAVFTDYNNSTRLSGNRNTCVYGHNMNDGTMFQTIMNFKEKNQFLNSTIELYTTEGLYVYIPFAAYDAEPTESFFKTEFASDEEFMAFLSDIRPKSIFTKPGITLDKNSRVVTLITCTNTVTDKRFVVHGVLDEIVK